MVPVPPAIAVVPHVKVAPYDSTKDDPAQPDP